MSASSRHQAFFDLHQSGCFVIPNPWDIGSSRMMAALGARALATTSAGFAFTLGRPDMGQISRDEALAHAQDIVAATDLPVSGDFENGFADAPDDVAETIKLAAEAGLSGCSIEDTQMVEGNPAYDFDLAVERVKAAAAAAKALPHPFVFCARADGVMNGAYGLEEAIRRIQAFEAAGADLLYVPVPPGVEELKQVLAAVSKPVNALAAGPLAKCSVSELAALGVRRISLGSMISRATHAVIRDATKAMLDEGSFAPLAGVAGGAEIDGLLLAGAAGKGGGR
ncbi:isocitrate lyase/PEP mutase family protein [Salaquimonas pukyongi]|uniref:isocitrate lyase/PEP mutase family protein n=1 Tax=Salaquimonas pukyongi TaxID=2712698 RepID=UPI00096B8AC3|nr:isocitrate lyase/phosphoenolpyruvate mutase family protein [Salaquimonas pukyongi]